MKKEKLKVFYDGACPLCSREINHYKTKDKKKQIDFVNIADPHFKAESEGLDPKKIYKIMHVKTPDGQIKTAMDAFRAIWLALPGYEGMAKLTALPIVNTLFNVAYHVFAHGIRPYLPKKKIDCESGTCNLH